MNSLDLISRINTMEGNTFFDVPMIMSKIEYEDAYKKKQLGGLASGFCKKVQGRSDILILGKEKGRMKYIKR